MFITKFNEHLNSWIEYTKNYEQRKITKPQYIYKTTEKSIKTRISGSFRLTVDVLTSFKSLQVRSVRLRVET